MRRILLGYPTLATALFSAMPDDVKFVVSRRLAETVVIPTSLIPVLGLDPRDVTGIQPRRVCAVNDLFTIGPEPPVPKDLGALDSCDIPRARP
ncbi:hypothetical protein RLEG12_27925 [Rhizobium leguminosarum bv. trifolii CB782]|uniref:Uncharacterized protein n=1 Tax=Rhizobium hidalgonense TaxID=1538159 RepID=A0ABX4JX58_9HYPH|nr:hypothetical protein RLEG12_27925 [Rhizobium leguminosarum bv. trifolii CB782]PDT24703.1 hypothetical protein CO674_05005 [Rhizobium hidalgonense]RWX15685.1 hypothetical protein EHI42_15090 [Rhizobium hidalgonense]